MRKRKIEGRLQNNLASDVTVNEVDHFVAQYNGISCDVMSEENDLLFAGKIGEYDPAEEIWRIDLRRGRETPRGAEYGMPVKLKMKTGHGTEQALLQGSFVRSDKDCWHIRLEGVEYFTENREAFRQTVSASGIAKKGDEEEAACRIRDISLTGIRFRSILMLETQDELILSNIQLVPQGNIYTFPCQIVRCKRTEAGEMEYGCRFQEISKREQDILWKEMLLLQMKTFI